MALASEHAEPAPRVYADIITIFPDYFAPLGLSVIGKARTAGLFDFAVHDLRRWTYDRHHTVDDTPYGGGAGMVMKPEPWGEALDAIAADAGDARPTFIFPSPAGEPFTQATARELFVHPNTVRYRLKRVSDVIGWDATGPREALILQTALIIGSIGTEVTRRRNAGMRRPGNA